MLAVVLTFAIYFLTTIPGFVRINFVPYAVPPVQPFLLLVILQSVNQLLRCFTRLPGWLRPLSLAELFLVYAALCLSLPMERGAYVIHYLTSGQYFGTDANGWSEIAQHYPGWFVPKDETVLQQWMEGAGSARVPWDAWRVPVALWFAFQMVMVFSVMCLVGLFRRQWTESERLTYPMLFIPLEVTGISTASAAVQGFFRNPYALAGLAVAAAINALNIAHAYVPAIPSIPWHVRIDANWTEGWLRFVPPLSLTCAFEMWGLAYLVSGEVLLTTWSLHFLMKAIKVIGMSAGYRAAGFPFFQEVSAGGFVAMAVSLVWVARPHLREVWRQVQTGEKSNEALPYRWLVFGLAAGTVVMVLFWVQAGLKPVLPAVSLLTTYVFALVAARVRAQAGPPIVWCHPYGYDQRMPLDLMGSRYVRGLGGDRAIALFGSMFWIGRTAFPHMTGQYFADGFRLTDFGHVRRSHMAGLMLLVCAVALGIAYWFHLAVGYRYGQALIGSRSGEQVLGWGFIWSHGQYSLVRSAMDHPQGPDLLRTGFYGGGFLFTLLLAHLRVRLSQFPFHPLGFLLATLYGDFTPYWFPFLFAWTAQRVLLRYGGLPLYRRCVPLFLGLALGHILIGGFVWRIVMNYFIDPSISMRYVLNLGG